MNTHSSDVALYLATNGESLTAATFAPDGSLALAEFPLGDSLYPGLRAWRLSLGQRTDLQTVFRFVPALFTEETRIAALPEEALHLPDDELTRWLVDAATRQTAGEDGVPLFDAGLEKSAYDFARLPDGQVTLTELPRELLRAALKSVLQTNPLDSSELANLTSYAPDEAQPFLLHAVETRLRAVTRFLAVNEDAEFAALAPTENIAVFAFTPSGCGFALWNPAQTFHAEYGECFELNFDDAEVPLGMAPADYVTQLYLEGAGNFLYEQFYQRVQPEIDGPAIPVRRIYWAASDGLSGPLSGMLREFAESSGFALTPLTERPLGEMVAQGLLLAHNSAAESLVPSINLAHDISRQHETFNAQQRNVQALAALSRRRAAAAWLALPFVLGLGLLAGLFLHNGRHAVALGLRETAAQREASRLQPVQQARAQYEKTLRWYEDVLRQIVALRAKQASALGFAAQLDPLYPQNGAFALSEMKLAPGGSFELKGLTRDERAVAFFVRSLEYAADYDDKRYFQGLQLEFKQGANFGATAQTAANGSGGPLPAGVSAFVIKGQFPQAAALKTAAPATNSTPAGGSSSAVPSSSAPASSPRPAIILKEG